MSGPALGFRSLETELRDHELPIEGTIPEWLSGSLVRNGPGRFEAGGQRLGHWFDGLAMVRKYAFEDGTVTYSNRFLRTESYELAMDGELHGQFSTDYSGLEKLRNWIRQLGPPAPLDNANINVVRIDGELVAQTEVPRWISFDGETLATAGEFQFADLFGPHMITGHLVADPETGELVGHGLSFGRTHEYHLFRIPAGTRRRELLTSIPTESPSYVHSIGVSQDHIVLAETPLKINIWGALSPFSEGFDELLDWQPDTMTQLFVVDRSTGEIVTAPTVEPFFTFHVINAFDDEDAVVLDLITFEDGSIIDSLRLATAPAGWDGDIPSGYIDRYRIEADGTTTVSRLHDGSTELPAVMPARQTRSYRYIYAQVNDRAGANGIVKVDTERQVANEWWEPGLYVEEPCPVQRPGPTAEDDGVVLAPALDTNTERSVLLIFDAETLTELGRATVPHVNPFGFHGRFFEDVF